MSGVQSIYEKMLQNPSNRRVSTMRQPTPFDGHDKVVPKKEVKQKIDEDDAFFRAVDRRMTSKTSTSSTNESIIDTASAKKIAKLEARIDELEELVTIMMKQQMKLMKE
jgi:hypothetical protein